MPVVVAQFFDSNVYSAMQAALGCCSVHIYPSLPVDWTATKSILFLTALAQHTGAFFAADKAYLPLARR